MKLEEKVILGAKAGKAERLAALDAAAVMRDERFTQASRWTPAWELR